MAAVQKARKVQKKVVKGVHGTRVKKVILIPRKKIENLSSAGQN